jgi:hypothetical protein
MESVLVMKVGQVLDADGENVPQIAMTMVIVVMECVCARMDTLEMIAVNSQTKRCLTNALSTVPLTA